jgi:glycosyltransferase involved in cell wall biosynthesis
MHKKIKIVFINPTDLRGGASIDGYRLFTSIGDNCEDINALMYVQDKFSSNSMVREIKFPLLWFFQRVLNKIEYFSGLQYLLNINWIALIFKKDFWKADIFVLGNMHGGFLPLYFPFILRKNAPVVWQIHDMWSQTGHCAYPYSCFKWETGCGKCPIKSQYPALFLDTTGFLFKLKKAFFNSRRIHLALPSSWIFENANRSPIFEKAKKYLMPYGVDTDVFSPKQKEDKVTLSFISGSSSDARKGVFLMPEIMRKLNDFLTKNKIFIDLQFIGEKKEWPVFSNINNVVLGFLKEKEIAANLAKSHLYILPTLADNLPNTVLESMSCGTPCVAFNVGGVKDMISHQETGYLASPESVEDFVKGIILFLSDINKLNSASLLCRESILKKFTSKMQLARYCKLFRDIAEYGETEKTK